MPISGSKGYRSGILSLPNRVTIRMTDSVSGTYPTTARTTGKTHGLIGKNILRFDDTKTKMFLGSDSMVYPIVQTAANISQSNTSILIASPNKPPTIITHGTSSDGLSMDGMISNIENGLVFLPYDETRIVNTGKSDSFYATGTKSENLPGFSGPLRDKISITIPINNSSQKIATRYNVSGINVDSSGHFPSTSDKYSGFLYYNPSLNRWEDIGLVDHLHNSSTNYKMYYQSTSTDVSKVDCWIAGTHVTSSNLGAGTPSYPKMQQFAMSDHMAVYLDSVADISSVKGSSKYSILTSSLDYHLIGTPTIAALAPGASIYHATSSQTLSIDNYINDPFALESMVLEIPVVVQRMRGTVAKPTEESRFYEACRDIDNYTFFIYRQTRPTNSNIDSDEHIETSRRYLIGSGCATFSNTNSLSGRMPAIVRSKGWPHKPAFSHDFLVASGAAANENVTSSPISVFSGTLEIKIKPAVANGQYLGGSRFPLGPSIGAGLAGGSVFCTDGIRSIVTQDFWPGGTTTLSGNIKPASSRQYSPQINTSIFKGARDPQISFAGSLLHSEYNNLLSEYKELVLKDKLGLVDTRPLANGIGLRSTGSVENTVSGTIALGQKSGILGYTAQSTPSTRSFPVGLGSLPNSKESPYLLLPGDEIVLGLDVGVSMIPSSGTNMTWTSGLGTIDVGKDLGFYSASSADNEYFGTVSGSFMKLIKGQAKLTLYGSLVRWGKGIEGESNQNITSDAIHEAVGNHRVTDQYDIPTRNDLSSSYVDRFIVGVMKSGSRDAYYSENSGYYENTINFNFGYNLKRSVRGLFSKNRTGIYSNLQNTIFSNYSVGAPPRLKYSSVFPSNTSVVLDRYHISRYGESIFDFGKGFRSLQRFVGLDCNKERFYDTVMPDIMHLALASPSLSVDPIPSGTYTKRITLDKHRAISYPYSGNPDRYVEQKYYLRVDASSGTIGSTIQDFKSDYDRKLVNVCLFQRGWNFSTYNAKTSKVAHFRHAVSASFGPLYGIMSPMPKYTSSKFRRDTYGQFRDMLEQRKDGKFFHSEEKNKSVNDSPIQVSFVNSSDGFTNVQPSSTDSVNFSKEYSSSFAYVEGDSLNPKGQNNVSVSLGAGPFYNMK